MLQKPQYKEKISGLGKFGPLFSTWPTGGNRSPAKHTCFFFQVPGNSCQRLGHLTLSATAKKKKKTEEFTWTMGWKK